MLYYFKKEKMRKMNVNKNNSKIILLELPPELDMNVLCYEYVF